MKKFIINETQERELKRLLKEEIYQDPNPQNPSMKKANKPYCINPDKVKIVKKFLDKSFTPHDWEKIGPDGLPMKIKIFSMNASNGEPLKWMYQDQLHDLLIDKFQNMFLDKVERDLFMKQVVKDWLNGSISIFGGLSTNVLKENNENELAAWHGGAQNFDQFKVMRGTGQGASMYGVGVYVTDGQDGAEYYAQTAAQNNGTNNGYVYQVEIPDDNGQNYINFEQPQNFEYIVKTVIQPLYYQYYISNGYGQEKAQRWAAECADGCNNFGGLFNNMDSDGFDRGIVCQALAQQGYVGFYVPSQGYHIIFNPQNVRIVNKTQINRDPNFIAESISSEEITAEANNANIDPTEKQKEAGNYKMGHISVKGMKISIENPQGSYRKYKDENGNEGRNLMKNHYGYFNVTKGKDGDAVDVFIGPNIENFENVYCVDQNNKEGNFDETKVMLGFDSAEEAKQAYLDNYSPDWKGFRDITGVSLKVFKKWLYRGRKQRQPFADYAYIQKKKLDEDYDMSFNDWRFNGMDNTPSDMDTFNDIKDIDDAFEGWKRVRRKSQNNKMNLKNKTTGEYISNVWYEWIGYLIDGYAIVEDKIDGEDKYNIINLNGDLVLPQWYDDVNTDDGETYIIKDGIKTFEIQI